MSAWDTTTAHNTYPGFCRDVCGQYGLVEKTDRSNSEICVIAAEKYFLLTRKRIADRCEKDPSQLLKHSSLKEFFESAWLVKRYAGSEGIDHKTEEKPKVKNMTVSLFKSTATGIDEIVVQTNAQTLEAFVGSFSEALADAIGTDPKASRALTISALKNAFPIAFALSGYKAEKVSEARLLTCGFASPDASELVAQSHV